MPVIPATPMEQSRALKHLTDHLAAIRAMRIMMAQIDGLAPEIDDYSTSDFAKALHEHREIMKHLSFVLGHLEWMMLEVSNANFKT